MAATLSVINIKLVFQGNYFTIASDAQPFLHDWSLSVEDSSTCSFPPS